MNSSDNATRLGKGLSLGEVLRRARGNHGLSIRQVAESIGVHHSFIARLEAGDYQSAKPPVLQRLSRALEVDERDLFALAGLDAPEGLPTFTPYLRAKYEISDEAAKAMQDYFSYLSNIHDIREKRPPAA